MTRRLVILRSALEYLKDQVRSSDRSCETGGVLLGSEMPDGSLSIIVATGSGRNAIKRPAFFSPDTEDLQRIVDSLRRSMDLYYVGEWHSHLGFAGPSSGDSTTAKEKVLDPEFLRFFVLLIANYSKFLFRPSSEFDVKAYTMDTTMSFYEVNNLKVIDEQDPRVQKILNGTSTKEITEIIKGPEESLLVTPRPAILDDVPFVERVWYQTSQGKLRLRREMHEIEELRFFDKIETSLSRGDLVLKCYRQNEPQATILLIFPPEYPLNPPDVLSMSPRGELKRIEWPCDWNSRHRTSDLIHEIFTQIRTHDTLNNKSVNTRDV